jgi:hypothetical protein
MSNAVKALQFRALAALQREIGEVDYDENLLRCLEICLKELERGADLNPSSPAYPELSDELRPILKTAVAAQYASGQNPPRSSSAADAPACCNTPPNCAKPRWKARHRGREIPYSGFSLHSHETGNRFLLSLLLFAASGISGIGLVNASASALPGDRLYPVKRGWENIRLMFAIDPNTRTALETQFYYERLSEVTALLAQRTGCPCGICRHIPAGGRTGLRFRDSGHYPRFDNTTAGGNSNRGCCPCIRDNNS